MPGLIPLGFPNEQLDVAVADAGLLLAERVVVGLLHHGEPVRQLEVAVAAQRCQQRRVVTVEVRVVDWAPLQAQRAPLALDGQVQLLGQAVADQSRSAQNQLAVAGEAALTPRRVLGVAAVRQRPPLRQGDAHDVACAAAAAPRPPPSIAASTPRAAAGGSPGRPGGSTSRRSPCTPATPPPRRPDRAPSRPGRSRRSAGRGQCRRHTFAARFGARACPSPEGRPATRADGGTGHLQMGVESSALLALDGAKHRVDPAQHPARGQGVAPERVAARPLRSGAVGAARAEPDSQKVAQRQEQFRV